MSCVNCDYWGFTGRGETEDGNQKSTCNRCGEVHVKAEEFGISHTAIGKPEQSTMIREGQLWKLKEDDSIWKVTSILVEPEELVEVTRIKKPEEGEDWTKELEPVKLLDQQTWNYYAEKGEVEA